MQFCTQLPWEALRLFPILLKGLTMHVNSEVIQGKLTMEFNTKTGH